MAPNTDQSTPTLSQLTLRGFDDALAARLHQVAAARDLSLNKAALWLMRRGAGLADSSPGEKGEIGTTLDRFIGVWSREDERELLEAIRPFDELDPELWR